VNGFASAMPVAVAGYFESVVRPAVRIAALLSYGKPASKSGTLPGEKLFAQNCAMRMRLRFPFPEPDENRCNAVNLPGLVPANLMAKAKANCLAAMQKQMPAPTAWERVCTEVRPLYQKAFAGESLKLIATIGKLKKKGCKPSAKDPKKEGLILSCTGPTAYSACLTSFGTSGQKVCRLTVPHLRISNQPAGGGNASAKPQVTLPAGPVKRDSTTPVREAPATSPARQPPPRTVPAPIRRVPTPPPPRRTTP
jgi:hypothetical protein